MKSLLLLSAVLFSAGLSAQSSPDSPSRSTEFENPLLGAWRLVVLEEPGAGGRVDKPDCSGMFVFTADGHASVQIMYRNGEAGNAYEQAGYEASYGTYHIDTSSIFTFHIEGALIRTLTGKDLKRAYEISGNRLTVKSTDPKEAWRVIWERY